MAFECTLMDDPVVAADGHTYNRIDMETWLKGTTPPPSPTSLSRARRCSPTWPSAVKFTRGARSTVCLRSSSDNLSKRRLAAVEALLLPELES
jgi:hypothetical protein